MAIMYTPLVNIAPEKITVGKLASIYGQLGANSAVYDRFVIDLLVDVANGTRPCKDDAAQKFAQSLILGDIAAFAAAF